jgi:hypothetical protein
MADVSLELLQALVQQSLQEQQATRQELADLRNITLHALDIARRIDRHITELRTDLETMLTSELASRLAVRDTVLSTRLDNIEARLCALEHRSS